MKQEALDKLLQDMSLEEKVLQLVQLPGSEYEDTAEITGVERGGTSARTRQLAGSTLGLWGRERLIRIQKQYMAAHPHHIPMLFMLDVIHGHRTVFPCPLAQGATFDPTLSQRAAAVQAAEAAADGIHVTFSPMTDLCRDARWGRVMESTGEDKLLNGRMASAMIRGYEGEDLSDTAHIAACVKHFAAYGAAEAGRDYNNVELSEHTLREYYLRAYGEAIRQHPGLVMTSFNTWNGIPATGSTFLMKQILREEMGFTGVLISDWGAIGEMVAHGYAADLRDAAIKAIHAGVDIDMCAGAYSGYLQALVEEGTVPEQLVDEAVMRVLQLKNALGLFEDPFRGLDTEAGDLPPVAPTDETRTLAREAVARSLVLLENHAQTLPLRQGGRIAFIGPYADNAGLQSSWAFSGAAADTVTVLAAAREAFGGTDTKLSYSAGCPLLDQDTMTARGPVHTDNWESERDRLLSEALEQAAAADTVVACLGESTGQSGEAASRAHLDLPAVQMALLRQLHTACHEAGKRLVVLLFTGRPLVLTEVRELADALMICWLPGTEGGHGIMDVLTGREDPAGRLSMSFPYTVGQEPLHYDSYATGRPKPRTGSSEFTSRYLDCGNEALYPFGYGLSYASFTYGTPQLSADRLPADGRLTATVQIRNTGDVAGRTTAQLYLRDMTGSRVRPVRELAGFETVCLAPGETREVSFEITEQMLRFWTAGERWASEPGVFTLWIGPDSMTEDGVTFTLD